MCRGQPSTRIDPIPEHGYEKDTGVACDNNDSIDRNDNKLGTEINEKEACPSSKCVAYVASVANIHDKNNGLNEKREVQPLSDPGIKIFEVPEQE